MIARVQNDGEYSEPFPLVNSVKQGCVLEPILFSMMISVMRVDSFQVCDDGIAIDCRSSLITEHTMTFSIFVLITRSLCMFVSSLATGLVCELVSV